MKDELLEHEPVYARLDWQWSWRGLTLMHFGGALILPLFLWPVLWFIQETLWAKASLLFVLPTLGASLVFVILAQYQQPIDAFSRSVARLGEPETLSPSCVGAETSVTFCEAEFK